MSVGEGKGSKESVASCASLGLGLRSRVRL